MRTVLLAATLIAAASVTQAQSPPGTRTGTNPEVNVEIDTSGNVRER